MSGTLLNPRACLLVCKKYMQYQIAQTLFLKSSYGYHGNSWYPLLSYACECKPCPPATFSLTNPLNISEIWTATKFYISMLQTSNLAVLVIFPRSFTSIKFKGEQFTYHCCKLGLLGSNKYSLFLMYLDLNSPSLCKTKCTKSVGRTDSLTNFNPMLNSTASVRHLFLNKEVNDFSSWNVDHVSKTMWKWSSYQSLICEEDITNMSLISDIHVCLLSSV